MSAIYRPGWGWKTSFSQIDGCVYLDPNDRGAVNVRSDVTNTGMTALSTQVQGLFEAIRRGDFADPPRDEWLPCSERIGALVVLFDPAWGRVLLSSTRGEVLYALNDEWSAFTKGVLAGEFDEVVR